MLLQVLVSFMEAAAAAPEIQLMDLRLLDLPQHTHRAYQIPDKVVAAVSQCQDFQEARV